MLFLMSKPKPFISQVTHVTLGKWLGCGLVLTNKSLDRVKNNQLDFCGHLSSSQPTTALEMWKRFHEIDPNAHANRRDAVLKKFNADEKEAWGEGVVIFLPFRRSDSMPGIKNRYLPLLDNTPIDKFPKQRKGDWSKEIVNAQLIASAQKWIDFVPSFSNDVENSLYPLFSAMVEKISVSSGDFFLSSADMRRNYLPNHNLGELQKVLKLAEQGGMVHYGKKTSKRLRGWYVKVGALSYKRAESKISRKRRRDDVELPKRRVTLWL
jgi:hypothetical protein